MNLHYSQTNMGMVQKYLQFHYLMNLHYSQTLVIISLQLLIVSLPYEFTLFSNNMADYVGQRCVSLPYEFTLFSNRQ